MSAFGLMPYENLVPGVRYRDDVLRLRPTWAATTLDLYGAALGLVFSAVAIATRNPIVAIAGATSFVLSLPYLRCRFVAEDRRVLVINKWRTSTVDVADIETARVQEFQPSWFLPFRDPLTIWPRTLTGCWLILRDGSRIRCDALVGLPRDSRSMGPGPVEVKAAILERWINSARTSPQVQ